jgi:hypothetical protein
MENPNQPTPTHLSDNHGSALLKHTLEQNNGLVLREYHPDYGIDFAVEIFKSTQPQLASTATLGEHVFVQLKSKENIQITTIEVSPRKNELKYAQKPRSKHEKATIEVIPITLETAELITVDRMGYGVPVLLVVADLEHKQCYFVCLNDYIDKVLVPQHGNYTSTKTRTIYVTVTNNLSSEHGIRALRWYGKRAKLLAAFHTFAYQLHELQWLIDFDKNDELVRMSRHFAERNMRYDFWGETDIRHEITELGNHLRQYHTTGQLNLFQNGPKGHEANNLTEEEQFIAAFLRRSTVKVLWENLANLSRLYAELWREWFLPTHLGASLSSPNTGPVDDNA